ncbi:MAG: T9SS type A sorting domain-containing protein, partial [Bacteroidales bacterium]|nr:T9SS type A sorting domain-containing protein [Bacteroidales bacterium]
RGEMLVLNTSTTTSSENKLIPVSFSLSQNYPNPFNHFTNINYELRKCGYLNLKIYDGLGNEVRTLVDAYKKAGKHSVVWDGENNSGETVSSGIYFYQLKTGDNLYETKQMLFLKL